MIQLLILDLDGTVIGSDGQVAECVWTAVEKAHAAGLKIAACTGRPGAGVALKVATRLGPRNGHIFQSGSVVLDLNGETLQVAALKEAVVLEMVRYSRELGHILELYTPTSMYIERRTPLSEAHAKLIGVTPLVSDLLEVARSEPVVRAQWLVPPDKQSEVERLPLKGVEIATATAPAMPDIAFVMATREGVDKGAGVRTLAEALDVDLAQVMAVGDSDGDVPMLEAVGHPLVMPSAPAEIRGRFPTLAKGVDECGAVEAIERALASRSG